MVSDLCLPGNADLTVCDLVQSEIAPSNVISWIKSISSLFFFFFFLMVFYLKAKNELRGGWVSSAPLPRLANTCTQTGKSPFQWGWYIYGWWVMTVLQPVPWTLTCFWCSTAFIYSNSRKKGQGAKPDAKPHCIPSNLLTVEHCFHPEGVGGCVLHTLSRMERAAPEHSVPLRCGILFAKRYSSSEVRLLCHIHFVSPLLRQKDTCNSRNKVRKCATLAPL